MREVNKQYMMKVMKGRMEVRRVARVKKNLGILEGVEEEEREDETNR